MLNIPVNAASDDAEESGDGSGDVSLTSSDLEMTYDGPRGYQTVGLRFNNIQIPAGASIANAYIQFTAERVNIDPTDLTLRGEASDNATTFLADAFNISSRTLTSASVVWTPPAWNVVGETGEGQRTSDIASIITEIISRPGWASGNAIAIIISGAEKRTAVSFDGNSAGAPVLHIEFTGDDDCPVVVAPCDDDDASTEDVIDIEGNCRHFKKVCDDGDPKTRDYFDEDGNCTSEPIVCDDDDPETSDYLDDYGVCHHVKTITGPCDECPDDPDKTEPGTCGCGNPDPGTPCDDGNNKTINDKITDNCECKGTLKDHDNDGTPDCDDQCPNDPEKTEPGECGCGEDDVDLDGDGVIDCDMDECPDDPDKTEPGVCGCGNPDTDSDGDGTPDCDDWCPDDPNKTEDGQCGCGTPETDSDNDGTPDCNDWCPDDPNKTEDGQCGCGNPEPGTPCNDGNDCTVHDKITEDCECKGTPKNTPECEEETCPDDPGTPCDDGDDCTENDQITEDCECEGTPIDDDENGEPDCDEGCPDLEGCENDITYPSCDKVIVCTGEKITQIVVDLGPTGFERFSVDPKFTAINDTHWEYTAPEGQKINGVWVKTLGYCDKCGEEEEEFSCANCEGDPCPLGNGGGRYYVNDRCECSEDDPSDTDEDGTPDCADPCPDDPENECPTYTPTCSDLEGCENEITFPACDQVVICTGERINQIVVDLGPNGFQDFSVDPKFTAIHSKHWKYTAPEGQTIQGVWVKTKGYCDKCGDEEEYSCVDCEGDPCPRGNGGGRYYKNTLEECVDHFQPQDDDDYQINMDLFPNPTTRHLNVKIKHTLKRNTGRVQILNSHGDRIYDTTIDEWSGDNLSIDLGNTPHGLYFIRVIMENGKILTKQFILAE